MTPRTTPPPVKALVEPQHPPFTQEGVQPQLARCKIGKAPGPDGILARVLKLCATELCPVFHSVLLDSYRTAKVPDLWKTSTIAPIPPKPRQSEPNHFRPVALTPIITKCMEKIMLHLILSTVGPQLDPHQFAYRPKRGTEDAVACLLHPLLHHLQTPNHLASVLWVDTTSAFNTIQRHQVIETLKHLDIIPLHLHWIYNILSNRPHAVKVGTATSSTLITNTGAPQGCVLSPFLCTLHTNDCSSPAPITTYYKDADDTAIIGLLSDNNSTTAYQQSTTQFSQWCTDNYLQLNDDKTKEKVIHTAKTPPTFNRTFIRGQPVELVNSFKYLGLTIDNKLNSNQHVINPIHGFMSYAN